ncbi:hypothetical protein CFC21_061247 [Triticum aestivum]|uniref:Pectinesterase inhibitor domain-containing protein n=2 Tax=Triticum aestivum TaxID=4565 RepID=A0A3B6JIQ1_WHEAT|nr:uncharacterized protein LOC123099755 [Triticum aestivum]KAF7053277.1 hypothetical protein CFC21_061247 [Triticum aestivum]
MQSIFQHLTCSSAIFDTYTRRNPSQAMASFSCSSSSVMSVILLLFSVLLAAAEAPAPARSASDQIILAACKTVGGGSTYFDVTFCLGALGSAGSAAGYQDLAAVAVDLLATNATSTEAKIDRLLGGSGVKVKPGDAALARCLRWCRSLYGGIVDDGPASTAAVKGGRFGEATAILEKAAAAAKECEGGFEKSKAASPLTAEDDDAFKLAKLAVALLRFDEKLDISPRFTSSFDHSPS